MFRRGRIVLQTALCLVLFITTLGWTSPLDAQTPDIVIDPRFYASATSDGANIYVEVNTEFWAGDRQYTPAELAALAPHFRFVDHALRGYTALVATPPQGAIHISNIISDGETSLSWLATTAQPSTATERAYLEGAPLWLRDQRVVRLRFLPVRHQDDNSMILTPTITVQLTTDEPWPTPAPPRPDPYWEALYRQTLVNYRDGRQWRRAPVSAVDTLQDRLAGPAPSADDPTWRVRVDIDHDGLHEIDYDDLAALGLHPAAIDPRRLQVYAGAQPIPALVVGEQDGSFDPTDSIVFYAPPFFSRYSRAHIFWLVLQRGRGQRVAHRQATESGALALPNFYDTHHAEVQQVYLSDFPNNDEDDHWFWAALRPGRNGATQKTFLVDLPGVASGPQTATMRVRVGGRETGIARVTLRIDGYTAATFDIRERALSTITVPFPHFLLRDGANEVVMEVSKVGDATNAVVLDWLEIDYVRRLVAIDGHIHLRVDWPGSWAIWMEELDATALVWDISNPLWPVMVDDVQIETAGASTTHVGFVSNSTTTADYQAATATARRDVRLTWAPALDDLRSPDNRSDYLIIAPDDFMAPAQRLAQHRAGQGLAVKTVALQTIYDDFNAGQPHPATIRAFLSYALSAWRAPAPAFVVLMGDGTLDPLGYLTPPPTGIPVFLRQVDPWLGEVADENAFVTVAGNDIAPDLMLGRLPVSSLSEAEQLVDKLIAYDRLPLSQPWQQRLLLVADNPDAAGDFPSLAEDMAALAAPSLNPTRFYLGQNYATSEALRTALVESWSEGALIVNYVGHGQPNAWAAEQLFGKNDVRRLHNQGRPALVLAMASLTGIFYQPGAQSLQEALLLAPDGRGAIAYVASTGYGIAAGNALVDEGFLQAILQNKVQWLGEATLHGKLYLFTQGYTYSEFLTSLFTLIGDPATHLPIAPWAQTYYLPHILRR